MSSKKKTKVIIEQDLEKPVEKKILAEAVLKISEGMGALLRAGLMPEDLISLIVRRCPTAITRTDVRAVLEAMDQLRRDYGAR